MLSVYTPFCSVDLIPLGPTDGARRFKGGRIDWSARVSGVTVRQSQMI